MLVLVHGNLFLSVFLRTHRQRTYMEPPPILCDLKFKSHAFHVRLITTKSRMFQTRSSIGRRRRTHTRRRSRYGWHSSKAWSIKARVMPCCSKSKGGRSQLGNCCGGLRMARPSERAETTFGRCVMSDTRAKHIATSMSTNNLVPAHAQENSHD